MPNIAQPPSLELPSLNDIQDIIKNDDGSYKVIYKKFKSKSGSRLVTASWTEVPHFDKKGNLLSPEKYKQMTIAKNGAQFFAQTEACVGGDTIINTIEFGDINLKDLFEEDIFL